MTKQNTIKQSDIFRKVGFTPHAGQIDILADSSRFKVVAAGRRFGKSALGGHDLTCQAILAYTKRKEMQERGKRMEYWIVGPEYSDAEKEFRVLWNDLVRLQVPFDKNGTHNKPLSGFMHISLWDGVFQVHAKSAKHPETLVGEGLHGVILAEAAKLKERVWTKFIRPTLNDFNGWAQLTSTPEGKNWFYNVWRQGQDPLQTQWASWRRPAWMNPHVYRKGGSDGAIKQLFEMQQNNLTGFTDADVERLGVDLEIGQLMRDLTPPMFKQEIAADFTEYVGRVFQDFDEEVHVKNLDFNPDWETYAGVDYGFTNPSVWLLIQVSPFGDVHVLDEVYERGLSPLEFAQEVKRRNLCPSSLLAFYPDPASPGDTRVIENELRVRSRGGTGGELKWRLEAIRKHLEIQNKHLPEGHVDRKPKLLINRKCVNVIREFNDYRYPDKKDNVDLNSPELPMKKDDHTPEALGRFFAGHFKRRTIGIRASRTTMAEFN